MQSVARPREDMWRCIYFTLNSTGGLVSRYFEPSRTKRVTSGLKTYFHPSYSFEKSLYHKSLLLKPQLKSCPQFRNANPEKQQHIFWSLLLSASTLHGNLHQVSVTMSQAAAVGG